MQAEFLCFSHQRNNKWWYSMAQWSNVMFKYTVKSDDPFLMIIIFTVLHIVDWHTNFNSLIENTQFRAILSKRSKNICFLFFTTLFYGFRKKSKECLNCSYIMPCNNIITTFWEQAIAMTFRQCVLPAACMASGIWSPESQTNSFSCSVTSPRLVVSASGVGRSGIRPSAGSYQHLVIGTLAFLPGTPTAGTIQKQKSRKMIPDGVIQSWRYKTAVVTKRHQNTISETVGTRWSQWRYAHIAEGGCQFNLLSTTSDEKVESSIAPTKLDVDLHAPDARQNVQTLAPYSWTLFKCCWSCSERRGTSYR